MNDSEALLRRQAEWQRRRRLVSWPEKVRMAEQLRGSILQLRAQRSGYSSSPRKRGSNP